MGRPKSGAGEQRRKRAKLQRCRTLLEQNILESVKRQKTRTRLRTISLPELTVPRRSYVRPKSVHYETKSRVKIPSGQRRAETRVLQVSTGQSPSSPPFLSPICFFHHNLSRQCLLMRSWGGGRQLERISDISTHVSQRRSSVCLKCGG
ncbi:hypothetical protein JOB18_026405 [Solea senegalensis]|uniref:Uncharacterized protein n=1 Tax=Solea senegalensis TaxID=28829 RepID=A0AAV6QW38_SOLSE|nr:hypothetical protein JOB18_026405 [Solea senegalensis]